MFMRWQILRHGICWWSLMTRLHGVAGRSAQFRKQAVYKCENSTSEILPLLWTCPVLTQREGVQPLNLSLWAPRQTVRGPHVKREAHKQTINVPYRLRSAKVSFHIDAHPACILDDVCSRDSPWLPLTHRDVIPLLGAAPPLSTEGRCRSGLQACYLLGVVGLCTLKK